MLICNKTTFQGRVLDDAPPDTAAGDEEFSHDFLKHFLMRHVEGRVSQWLVLAPRVIMCHPLSVPGLIHEPP